MYRAVFHKVWEQVETYGPSLHALLAASAFPNWTMPAQRPTKQVMCNLYSQSRSREEIARLFQIGDNRIGSIPVQPAIFPGWDAPVIRHAADGSRECVTMNWGFVLPQPGKAPRRVTNVRDDKVLSSKFWRPSFDQRRCLVPFSSYCEPTDEKPARWTWFALNGDGDRPLAAFPGIWRKWIGSVKKDGPVVEIETYAFMTTEPNALTSSINHERMPVLLSEQSDFDTWLHGSAEQAFALCRSFDATKMMIVQQGADKKDLLAEARATSMEQSGL